jgi:predicted  nucleic acid-binding Zn-ribbon protein
LKAEKTRADTLADRNAKLEADQKGLQDRLQRTESDLSAAKAKADWDRLLSAGREVRNAFAKAFLEHRLKEVTGQADTLRRERDAPTTDTAEAKKALADATQALQK